MKEKNKKFQGSILAVSLIIMGIVLAAALSIATVSVQERKSSIGANSSDVVYQYSDSAVEAILRDIYSAYENPAGQTNPPNNPGSPENLSAMATNVFGDNCSVVNGQATVTGMVNGKTETLSFLDKDKNPLPDCSSNYLCSVHWVKSVGNGSDSSRAISVPMNYDVTTGLLGNWRFDTNTLDFSSGYISNSPSCSSALSPSIYSTGGPVEAETSPEASGNTVNDARIYVDYNHAFDNPPGKYNCSAPSLTSSVNNITSLEDQTLAINGVGTSNHISIPSNFDKIPQGTVALWWHNDGKGVILNMQKCWNLNWNSSGYLNNCGDGILIGNNLQSSADTSSTSKKLEADFILNGNAHKLQILDSSISTGWHHLALTWDNNASDATKGIHLYLDGIEQAYDTSVTSGLDLTGNDVGGDPNGLDITLGKSSDWPYWSYNSTNPTDPGADWSRELNGYVDDFRIYNRVLSSQDIRHLASGCVE